MFDAETLSTVTTIADRLDCAPAALCAVIEVESSGRTGARVKGEMRPVIRFEGHYFDRRLSGEQRDIARAAKLADPKPGAIRNPRGQAARWAMLDRAIAIDRRAALESCSWGVGQVMGAHWKWLGYGSADAMVAQARSGVAGQVELMARYIEKASLAPALRARNWHRFARIYNGPAYAAQGYHTKMAAAYARWVEKLEGAPAASTTLKLGSRGEAVRRMQTALRWHGFGLRADGVFGVETQRELRLFQQAKGLPVTGRHGSADAAALAAQPYCAPKIVAPSSTIFPTWLDRLRSLLFKPNPLA